VKNWAGRIRLLPPAEHEYQTYANQRIVMNTPIQGGALDIIKKAIASIIPLLRDAEKIGVYPVTMTHVDLGFERAGHECILQVENDPFCRRVLAKHWPDVRRIDEVSVV